MYLIEEKRTILQNNKLSVLWSLFSLCEQCSKFAYAWKLYVFFSVQLDISKSKQFSTSVWEVRNFCVHCRITCERTSKTFKTRKRWKQILFYCILKTLTKWCRKNLFEISTLTFDWVCVKIFLHFANLNRNWQLH